MARSTPFRNPSGERRWRVQFRIDGHGKQETFKTAEAAEKFAKLVNRVGGQQAREHLQARRSQGALITFGEWAEKYLDPRSGILTGIQPGTRRGYERIVNSALVPFFGDYPLDEIGRDDVGRWVEWIESQPSGRDAGKLIAAKTVKNYQAVLSNVFKAAVDRDVIPKNPARGVRITEGVSREGVFLTPYEFNQILQQVLPHYRPLVAFLVDTGCRWGEATALTWADINMSVRPTTARINKAWKKGVDGRPVLGPPKSKKSRRTVPLGDLSFDYLPPQGKPGDLVFQGVSGGRIWYGPFNTRIWKRAVANANIGKTPNIHDLRHTCASWLIAGGVPITDVQAQLGHEKIDTTASVYSHLAPDTHLTRSRVMNAATQGVSRPVLELSQK